MNGTSSSLIRPKFVALDSSHLGAVAADKATNDRTRRQRAQAFEKAFDESGSVLLLCWHHLQELFSHGREDVVAQRVAYLQSLPMVAVVGSFRREGIIGAVIDLQLFEVAAAFNNPAADVLTVRGEAAKNMFRLASGADLVRPFLEDWSELRQAFAEWQPRSGEVVAISRSNFAGNSDVKIVDLLKGGLRAPEDTQRQFQRMHEKLSTDIKERGDKRILDPEASSQAFLEGVRRLGMEAIQAGNPALRILQLSGIDLSEIGPDTTVDDVGNLTVFRRKLELLNEHLGLPWPELKARVKEDRLPSGVIHNAIARYHPDMPEWDGSELADRYLACLAAYADITYVDKRTHEALRQARKKSKVFASLVRRTEKAGGYSEIADHLSALMQTGEGGNTA